MLTSNYNGEHEAMVEDALDLERPRGILTKKDREFILSGPDEDASANSVNQRRYQIRRRVQNALLDFELLNHLSDKDRKLIFDPIHSDDLTELPHAERNPEAQEQKQNLENGIHGIFEFLYRGMGYRYFDQYLRVAVGSAIHAREMTYRDRVVDVNVTFSATIEEDKPVDEIAQRLEEATSEEDIKEFTVEELYALRATGRISEEDHERLRAIVMESGGDEDLDDAEYSSEQFDENLLLTRYRNGGDLNSEELGFLHDHGHIESEEYERAYQDAFDQDEEDEHILRCTDRIGWSVDEVVGFDIEEAREDFDMEAAREEHADKAEDLWRRYNESGEITTNEARCLYYEGYLDRNDVETIKEQNSEPVPVEEIMGLLESQSGSEKGQEDDFGWW